MKGSRSLVMSLISVLLSLVTLMAASFAWLSSNKEVGSNGMEMQVDTTANLIISANASEIKTTNLSSVDFSGTPNSSKYKPTTHFTDNGNPYTGLHHVVNTGSVDYNTGLIASPTYAQSSGAEYYKDYTVYIASSGKALTDATLNAEILTATKGGSDVNGESSLMATSIDFYVDSVSKANYRGTSNVASKNSVDLQKSEIPLSTANTNNYITVIMRVYFDGALTVQGGTKTYINSATLDTDKVSINVRFTATGNDA